MAGKEQQERRGARLESNYARGKITAPRPEGTGYPECQKNPDIFETVEQAVGEHIDRNRDLRSPDIAYAQEIRTYLGWCHSCFMKTACLEDMIWAKYTGIAGGQFLYKGQVRKPKDDK